MCIQMYIHAIPPKLVPLLNPKYILLLLHHQIPSACCVFVCVWAQVGKQLNQQLQQQQQRHWRVSNGKSSFANVYRST